MRSQTFKIWFSFFVIFFSGMMLGGLGGALYTKHKIKTVLQGGPVALGKVLFSTIDHELSLTKDQRPAVAQALAYIQREATKRRYESQDEIKALIAQEIVKLTPLLSAEQLEKLNSLREQARGILLSNENRLPAENGSDYLN